MEPIAAELREGGVALWVMGAGRYPHGAEALNDASEAAPEGMEAEDVWRPPDMGETALYIFTSGTTGGGRGAGGGGGAAVGLAMGRWGCGADDEAAVGRWGWLWGCEIGRASCRERV